MRKLSVPFLIHQSLGGDRFCSSTGCRQAASTPVSVSYHLPENRSRANYVVISVNRYNLYDMEFFRPEPFDRHPTIAYLNQSLHHLSELLFDFTGLTIHQP